MALFDKAKNFYDNLNISEDILGVGLSGRDKMLLDAGILKKEDVNRARDKSRVQGLLNMALNYAIQPKNKGYGSPLPYLATAVQSGIGAAQKPYDNLGEIANLRQTVKDIKLKDEMEEARNKLFVTPPPLTSTKTIMSPAVDNRLMDNKGVQLAPSYQMSPQNVTNTTTFPERLDMDALSKFAVKFPDQAKSIYDNFKTQAEIGQINYEIKNPESFRPATKEEILAFGSDPDKGGQVNTKTGKFIPGSSPLVSVDLSKKGKELEQDKAITYFNEVQKLLMLV